MPGRSPFEVTTILYGAALALWLASLVLRRRALPTHARAAIGVFWFAGAVLAAQAVLEVVRGAVDRPMVVAAYAAVGLLLAPALVLPGLSDADRAPEPALAQSATLAIIATVAVVARLGVLT